MSSLEQSFHERRNGQQIPVVLKGCSRRSGRNVISISFNQNVSEPHPSQPEVSLPFDRPEAIESIVSYVKCIYHVKIYIGR